MEIIINGLQINEYSSGIGKMMLEIATSLSKKHSVTMLVSKGVKLNVKFKVIEIPFKNSSGLLRNFYQSFIIGSKYCKNAVFITSDSKIPLLVPKNLLIVPIITDLAVYRMPNVYKLGRTILWKTQYKILKKHYKKVIAVSEYTKKDINEILKIPEEKIEVVPCAANNKIKRIDDKRYLKTIKEKYNLPEKYIFFIGNLNPRKNLLRLYKAFKNIKEELNLPHKLVISGAHGWKYKNVLSSLVQDTDVILTGYVTEKEKIALYTLSDTFVFPSLYEGFGIPILEAQSTFTPVITSNVSAMPEVAGDGAVFVDPYDVKDIEEKLKQILTDENLRKNIVLEGEKNVKRFSWDKSAKKISDVISELLNGGN